MAGKELNCEKNNFCAAVTVICYKSITRIRLVKIEGSIVCVLVICSVEISDSAVFLAAPCSVYKVSINSNIQSKPVNSHTP
jgi:hypothetical protein